jgi:hypothetical protein
MKVGSLQPSTLLPVTGTICGNGNNLVSDHGDSHPTLTELHFPSCIDLRSFALQCF